MKNIMEMETGRARAAGGSYAGPPMMARWGGLWGERPSHQSSSVWPALAVRAPGNAPDAVSHFLGAYGPMAIAGEAVQFVLTQLEELAHVTHGGAGQPSVREDGVGRCQGHGRIAPLAQVCRVGILQPVGCADIGCLFEDLRPPLQLLCPVHYWYGTIQCLDFSVSHRLVHFTHSFYTH
jgi:hypothetical protein